MTVATVDKVLDEVRPILMADGGDVEVREQPGPHVAAAAVDG
jgi:Fe-S cluster biogenesis protein NfuA